MVEIGNVLSKFLKKMVWFATKRLTGFGGMFMFLWQKRRSGALFSIAD
jgi:hypothetical protein